MPCKNCRSENVQKLSAELTASFPDFGDAKVPPVYICQDAVICMACGFLEMQVPKDKLESLKENKTGHTS